MDNLTTGLGGVSPAVPIEKYSLLRDAYAIIDGIPEERFNLQNWRSYESGLTDCGTIACAAGWLTMHPDMQALGLATRGQCHSPAFNGVGSYDALARFFGIDNDAAAGLFRTRSYDGRDTLDPPKAADLSDKQLWLARVREFLRRNA